MRLTTMRYYTPKGQAIQARGIAPNVLIRPAKLDPTAVLREHGVQIIHAACVIKENRLANRADEDSHAIFVIDVHRVVRNARRGLESPGIVLGAVG